MAVIPRTGVADFDPRKLVEARKALGWSGYALAKNSGTDKGNVWRYERGLLYPEPRTLQKLADALGVDPRSLRASESEAA